MIITKEIDYQHDDTVCRGFVAYDDGCAQPMPCVLIAHDWSGRSDRACDKAKQLAQLGYVGFALDMYGQARTGEDNDQRNALMRPILEDRQQLGARMVAAFNCAKTLPEVDENKISAIGYCFGGLCVLDLVRLGVNMKGAISFHGLLYAPEVSKNTPINTKILVLHGYDDLLVKPDQVQQFATEMDARHADWQVHMYGHTEHSFTNPEAHDPEMGLLYNALADRRSWQSAKAFLAEVFE
jgi:dienelactone hydrolase